MPLQVMSAKNKKNVVKNSKEFDLYTLVIFPKSLFHKVFLDLENRFLIFLILISNRITLYILVNIRNKHILNKKDFFCGHAIR